MQETVNVGFRKEHPQAVIPVQQTPGSAGSDLCAVIEEGEFTLLPWQRHLFSTGLAMIIPKGFEVQIRPRSGLAIKHGVTVLNAPGTVDSDFSGTVGVILINLSDTPFCISHLDRIAQMVVSPVVGFTGHETDQVIMTERGSGGFGSTGTGTPGLQS
ncbi:dUTP diphosphatase [Pseudosulfitobacter pseudonitzschiae]|uniref:dUTP diphosphatase n=1 Tax=Pseudosulfitobacter pseudonitzschiae TaxID=1402135 RepID=UPI003B7A9EBF